MEIKWKMHNNATYPVYSVHPKHNASVTAYAIHIVPCELPLRGRLLLAFFSQVPYFLRFLDFSRRCTMTSGKVLVTDWTRCLVNVCTLVYRSAEWELISVVFLHLSFKMHRLDPFRPLWRWQLKGNHSLLL